MDKQLYCNYKNPWSSPISLALMDEVRRLCLIFLRSREHYFYFIFWKSMHTKTMAYYIYKMDSHVPLYGGCLIRFLLHNWICWTSNYWQGSVYCKKYKCTWLITEWWLFSWILLTSFNDEGVCTFQRICFQLAPAIFSFFLIIMMIFHFTTIGASLRFNKLSQRNKK